MMHAKTGRGGTMMRNLASGMIAAMMLCFLATAVVWGQATAQMSGTVRDTSGAVLPGVQVTATQTETGISRTALTNEAGFYALPSLPLGPYKVEASLSGFRTLAQTGLVLQVGSNPVIEVAMEAGQVTQVIEVKADAAIVKPCSLGSCVTLRPTHVMPLLQGMIN